MGKLFLIFAALASFSLSADQGMTQPVGSHLQWKNSYEEALSQSKTTSKPIVLFFTGSDWCGWCHKLEKEVLNTPEFADLAGKEFLFVTVDFPLYKPSDPKVAEENKRLQKKFDVKGFPTLVLIDKDEQQIGTTGYRPGGAKAYAEHLMKMMSDYMQYKQKVHHADKTQLTSTDLKMLYQKATELGRVKDATELVSLGLLSNERAFFLMETYRLQAAEGRINSPEAQAVKQEILNLDPKGFRTHYEIALIEFEAYSEEILMESYSPDHAVEPLIDYIKKYGKVDKENVWKLQIIISQVFLDKNQLQQALDFARASYETAPDPIKTEIAIAVKNLQTEIKK